MPFALVFIGLMMIVSGARDTHQAFGAQLTKDFTGPGNFTYWLVALGGLGAIGYIDKIRPLSHAFMALVIISMILSNGGFFAKFTAAIQGGPIAPEPGSTSGGSAAAAPTVSTATANDGTGTFDYTSGQTGAFGQTPRNPADAKFNGWMTYFLGGGWLK